MLGIPQQNNNAKKFAKVIKQSDPVDNGMYKAIFTGFTTLGFQDDDFNEGQVKFYVNLTFEGIEDMAGTKLGDFTKEYDDGKKEVGPRCFFREIPLADDMHHKSNGFAIAKALDPNVATVTRGKENEHTYIVGFDWEKHLGKTVLLQISKRVAKKSGNPYNKLESVMPLGIPLEGRMEHTFFNLYNSDQQEVFDKLDGFTKKKIRESKRVPGEPEVIYRGEVAGEEEEAPKPPVEAPEPKAKDVDFDDDIPF